ncbi:MAG: hypothetical protein KDA05_09425 [Phycisphaerales bacterium]|nr:hypothetical protein [Phycisphaerales bacterium]MCB9840088.1 hypothetical protein [Phycisphaeraceae bacterium]
MLDEDDIITHAALRLDGYACLERTGFDTDAAGRRCLAARECDLATLEAMMVLFTLQRWLFKWGGEMLQRTHPDWWLCRECFLRTAREPTPPEHADARYIEPWNERFVPRLDEAIGIVASAHEATAYLWPPER